MTEPSNQIISFNSVVRYAWKYRITLILVTIAATIITYGITQLITPLFKSTAVIYASSPVNSGKEAIEGTASYRGIAEFGNEDEAEQLMEVVSSNTVKRKVASQLNLWEHYGIDTSNPLKNYYLENIISDNIKLSLSRFNALRIEVYDFNPAFSALLANTLATEADSAYRAARKTRTLAAYEVVKAQMLLAEKEYNNVVDSLIHYRKLGVLDLTEQTRAIYRAKAEAVAQNKMEEVERLNSMLKPLERYSAQNMGLEFRLENTLKEISILSQNLKVAQVEAEQDIPSIFVIDKAVAPEIKAYPKRMLISISTGIASFVLALFILMLSSYLKNEIFNSSVAKSDKKQ
ncbi:MAG TPA: Wzz/FepE/Etk N-terminal domain-containing protein [Williamwhitmania sp.]|nr:Wzz/FepE/Etk N-terminal domain-containing protein [Williamwhitmania sp.]